jgi:integrase
MGRLYKRGQTWWGDWRDAKGQRHQRTLATRDRVVAADRLREAERAPADRPAHGPTLTRALTYLLEVVYAGRAPGTVNCYTTKARHLVRLLGADVAVTELRREDVLRYRAERLSEGAAETTIAKELVTLRLALREQGVDGVVPRSPARYEPRTRHLSEAEALAVVGELAPARRLWLMVACYAGLRAGELERLDWSDVDLRRGWIRVRGTKTRASIRPVPIAEPLRPWLEAAAGSGPVLERWPNQRRDLAQACARAGVPPVTANDLRRTFASWLVQGGASTLAVAHLLGHSSTRMVELVYGRLTPAVYEAAVGGLPGCNAGVPPVVTSRANLANVAKRRAAQEARKRAK